MLHVTWNIINQVINEGTSRKIVAPLEPKAMKQNRSEDEFHSLDILANALFYIR
jgi:hypothetical protein